nr:MAG TPA: hypothetical protein [Caudoviricetes sp.]
MTTEKRKIPQQNKNNSVTNSCIQKMVATGRKVKLP